MKALGLDLGTKNLGVAVSDSEGEIAVPHSVITLSGEEKADLKKISAVVDEVGAEIVVVGLPLNLKGEVGKSAELAKKFVISLQAKLTAQVVLHDERFSTTEANKLLQGAGMSSRKIRSKIDMMAASVILQSWLDTQMKKI